MSAFGVHPDGVLLRLLVQPKASRTEWVGRHGEGAAERLKLRIAAPPVDGEANEEVLHFLRKSLRPAGIRDARLIRGHTSKRKDVLLVGASLESIKAVLDLS